MVFTVPVRTDPVRTGPVRGSVRGGDPHSARGDHSAHGARGDHSARPTRRALLRGGADAALAAAALGALAGCGLLDEDPPAPAPPDPLAPLLAGTVDLLARYDAALAAQPDLAARLTPVREAHAAHAAALAALIGVPTPSPAPGPSAEPTGAAPDARGTLAALRAAEQGGRRAAADACLAAPAERATLLGTIAAARASHVEALR
jgi:hypothetical protein